jgi:Fur family ferric uptake transcriptional regulator
VSKRPTNYTTKQGAAILDLLESRKTEHFTAAEVAEHFAAQGISIGRATVYRHLERLAERGRARRFVIDETSGACYQYIDEASRSAAHFHLKCESCGDVIHMDGGSLPLVAESIQTAYDFAVDVSKTVFYGKCGDCAGKTNEKNENKSEKIT